MPGDDVTHPVPDNTGYITEGQFYLHDGVIDPFGSLSRLKQHVIGEVTRHADDFDVCDAVVAQHLLGDLGAGVLDGHLRIFPHRLEAWVKLDMVLRAHSSCVQMQHQRN